MHRPSIDCHSFFFKIRMYIKYLWIQYLSYINIFNIYTKWNHIRLSEYISRLENHSRWKVRHPIVVLLLGFGVNRSVAEKSRSSRTKMARFTMDNAGKIFKPLIVPDNHCVCRKSAPLFTISFKHEIVLSKNACPWWCMPDSTVGKSKVIRRVHQCTPT